MTFLWEFLSNYLNIDPRKKIIKGFCVFSRYLRNPIYDFFSPNDVLEHKAEISLSSWLGLSKYATNQKNSGGSKIYSISTICDEVAPKFCKNSRSLAI